MFEILIVCLILTNFLVLGIESMIFSLKITRPGDNKMYQNPDIQNNIYQNLKHPWFNGALSVLQWFKENVSQNAKFSTKFPTLNKDFSEMRKFQQKPLKPQLNTCLKTPNPEGF